MSLYQIAVFANGSDSHAATLRATIDRSFPALGIRTRMLSFLDEASVSTRDHKSPVVSVYFGPTPTSRRSLAGAFKSQQGCCFGCPGSADVGSFQ
jgi:hypothetical protein